MRCLGFPARRRWQPEGFARSEESNMSVYIDSLIKAVGDVPHAEGEERDFCNTMLALLGSALAKLPECQRDEYLHDIECGGMREIVRQFEGAHSAPDSSNERLN